MKVVIDSRKLMSVFMICGVLFFALPGHAGGLPGLNPLVTGPAATISRLLVVVSAAVVALSQGVAAGTCVCSSGVTWGSCPHGNACNSFCSSHGGTRYWSGPN